MTTPAPAPAPRRSPQTLPSALDHIPHILKLIAQPAATTTTTTTTTSPTAAAAAAELPLDDHHRKHTVRLDEAPPPPTTTTTTNLANHNHHHDNNMENTSARRLLFFLDYDGTLSPIVEDPDSAIMPDETRTTLARLAQRHTTAIVTGRSLAKVRKLVLLDQLIYAGSHGFDIAGPPHVLAAHTVGEEFRPNLLAASARVATELIPHYPGATLEDNHFALSVHYRNVDTTRCDVATLGDAVARIAADCGLTRTLGKMVYEIRPKLNWHKGKAVDYLLDILHMGGPDVVPIYIGDDVTDEDAFEVLNRRGGITVIVADAKLDRLTAASLRLVDTLEVRRFLNYFAGIPDNNM